MTLPVWGRGRLSTAGALAAVDRSFFPGPLVPSNDAMNVCAREIGKRLHLEIRPFTPDQTPESSSTA